MKTLIKSFKVLISNYFKGYASEHIKNGLFETAENNLQKAYKWCPDNYSFLTIKMVEGVLRKKEQEHDKANEILLYVTKTLQETNSHFEYLGFEKELSVFEKEFGEIKNIMKKPEKK